LKRSALGVALGVVLVASGARAQAQDKAVADAMFNEGLKLLHAGKFADACPKLAESERIDPAVGTALYLGECYERTQKIASAQAMFQEAFDLARRRGDSRAQVAKDHHDKLVPSTLTIVLAPAARVQNLQITRDGLAISQVELGVALPADGGAHTIAVSAPGKKSWSAHVDVPTQSGAAQISIPALEDEPAPQTQTAIAITAPNAEPAPFVVASRDAGKTRRLVGVVTAGAGVATIVVGALAGTIAMLDWNASNSSDNGCDSGTTACPTQHGVDLRASAQSWATVSTATLIVGGALVVAGAILFFTAPKARTATALAAPGTLAFHF